MEFLFDYTVLRLIWWALLGVLFWGFVLMDGFDLGVAILLPFVGRTDTERRIIVNSVGPVWEGNQVWLILAAGAIFAAWPHVYSVLFSGLYLPVFGVLCSLILRPVGFKYRSKLENPAWRQFWDGCLFVGGIVPAFCFGLVLAHLILGLPFMFDAELRLSFLENPNSLFHPLACCSGLLWVLLCAQRGGAYLLLKTEPLLQSRIRAFMTPSLWGSGLLFVVLLGLLRVVPEYAITQSGDASSDPLSKIVTYAPQESAKTLLDYIPLHGGSLYALMGFAILAVITGVLVRKGWSGWAFVTHGLQTGVVIAVMGVCHFPIILLSNVRPEHSLTIWDASSSALTLKTMLIAALIFVPLIIAYTAWVYRVMRGPVRKEWIEDKSKGAY